MSIVFINYCRVPIWVNQSFFMSGWKRWNIHFQERHNLFSFVNTTTTPRRHGVTSWCHNIDILRRLYGLKWLSGLTRFIWLWRWVWRRWRLKYVMKKRRGFVNNIQKFICWFQIFWVFRSWKKTFIEYNMSRYYDLICVKIKTPIPSMLWRISEKETWRWKRWEYMCCRVIDIWKTEASKHMQMVVCRLLFKHHRERSFILNRRGWNYVYKIFWNMKSFNPKRWWELSLKENSTNGIINCLNHPFRFTILLRGMRTSQSKKNTIGVKVLLKLSIDIFSSVITFKWFDIGVELGFDVGRKMKKFWECFTFSSKWIHPKKVWVIV